MFMTIYALIDYQIKINNIYDIINTITCNLKFGKQNPQGLRLTLFFKNNIFHYNKIFKDYKNIFFIF